MEPLLLVATAVSLVLGAGMTMVAWRLLRRQREQSAARVEALQALAAAADDRTMTADETPVRRTHPVDRTPVRPAYTTLDEAPIERPAPPAAPVGQPWDAMREAPPRPARREPEVLREIDVRFAGADEPRAPGRRWVALAAVAAAMVLGFSAVYGLYSTSLLEVFSRATTATASGRDAAAEPLQLLSLKHATEESGNFVLTGLVQNPSTGRPLRGVVAVVYLFDQQGRYFAGGKTSLDVTTLHPGEESPFVVRVPAAAGVTRYRVGFRMDDGGVVAHVDRRGQLPGGTLEDAVDDEQEQPVVARPLAPRRSEG